MRCKVRFLTDVDVNGAKIPAKTLVIVDEDVVQVWVKGDGVPVNLRGRKVVVEFEGLPGGEAGGG